MFVRAEGFKPGGYVVVFGAGPIGLASIALAKASGASKIIAFEISNRRRELARLVGAEYVYNPAEVDPVEVILDVTKGAGADMLVESAGAPTKTIPVMEKTLAIGGKIVQIGRAAERVPVYLEYFQTHAGQIFGAQGHSGYGTFQNVIRLMASGRIDMTQIITSRFSLSDAVSAIKKTSQREDGKVMVRM